jgi:hypothetical protein
VRVSTSRFAGSASMIEVMRGRTVARKYFFPNSLKKYRYIN